MNTNQQDNSRNSREPNQLEQPSHGAQGIDKAPGEETAGDTDNMVQDTQRGKNKVDGDPDQPSDQPASNPQ